ncbi:alpha/beta hydrolase [Nocardia sp. NPDC048505]|uniref:alpha/beta fold hydrolase n=1 Tax=unclassified Nocardia TaxID=2637762 RepID=UPI0033E88D64
MATEELARWREAGETVEVRVRGVRRRVFVRKSGSGTPLVLLHGFPASSFEWAGIEPALARRHTVVAFDFLGYGGTEKPRAHRYSVFEQADLVEALLDRLAISETAVLAYDYGAIVASELLARADRACAVTHCVFMNAGLYAHLYRPRLIQRVSRWPVLGRVAGAVLTERVFAKSWGAVFSPEHPLEPRAAASHYRALRENAPERDLHRRLLRYIPERAAHRERLEAAVAKTEVPLSFLWGMRDPVAGSAIAAELRRRRPGLDLVEYSDAGHCPHLEIPDRVAADILARLG